uniref:BLOC-1-related complex subunit 6 C-terminal helix domain-containing protein n=1 Tax=Lotus japonicus TaxID=34305 RepID=I3T5D7_LOTJA|nr:unknown [Lotus japonicus]
MEDGEEASNPIPNPVSESEAEETTISISISDGGSSFNQNEIFRAIEIVERDSFAIAQSFTSLFASLRLALSQSTTTSLHHINSLTHASARLQESVLDAATKGNRYINSCLRLNEEMKNIDGLASQLKILRRHVDVLDSAVNKLVHDAS